MIGAIAGDIAEAFYGGVPDDIGREARRRLTPDLLAVVDNFYSRFTR
jgi:ADP-ribosylglycohydrolase